MGFLAARLGPSVGMQDGLEMERLSAFANSSSSKKANMARGQQGMGF